MRVVVCLWCCSCGVVVCVTCFSCITYALCRCATTPLQLARPYRARTHRLALLPQRTDHRGILSCRVLVCVTCSSSDHLAPPVGALPPSLGLGLTLFLLAIARSVFVGVVCSAVVCSAVVCVCVWSTVSLLTACRYATTLPLARSILPS